MADKDSGNTDGPSLELPSFGFGRKRRGKDKETVQKTPPPADQKTPPPGAPAEETADPTPTAAIPGAAAAAAAAARESQQVSDEATAEGTPGSGEPKEPFRKLKLPDLPGRQAAAVTGLVVGLLGVAATYLSQQLCSAIRGTTSCGAPGLLLLLAILIALILVGAALLRAFHVPDPGSTSFLAVGLLAVIALLFLIEVLLSWTMVIAIPVASVVTYLLSHWVTTAFIEPARDS